MGEYKVPRAAENAQVGNHIICWLGGRAHEVAKELNQQIDKIIAGAKSNVKYPNLRGAFQLLGEL